MKTFRAIVRFGQPDHVVVRLAGRKKLLFRACDGTAEEESRCKRFRLNRVRDIICDSCRALLVAEQAFTQGEIYE